jgi:hypothetical protein
MKTEDSDSGSDTEFEDDLLHIPKLQDQFNLLEEKRELLEKQLGAAKFIQLYKSIEVLLETFNISK